MATMKEYAMPINDANTGIHRREVGDANNGLSDLTRFGVKSQPLTEQARVDGGTRSEDMGDGFKLVQ